LKRYLKQYIFLFILAGAIIALDQWSKSLVRANLDLGEMWSPWELIAPYFRIVHWKNTGVAFGMFQNLGQYFKYLPIIVAAAIIYYFPRVPEEDWPLRVAMGMQLAGAFGNWIDRITIGYVVDFISVGGFPVFNVADSSITIGVGILLLGMYLQERKEKKRALEESTQHLAAENTSKSETV
jgi:signal peptidase II